MKITEDVRKFAAEQKISEEQALQVGLEQKAGEFVEKGAQVYARRNSLKRSRRRPLPTNKDRLSSRRLRQTHRREQSPVDRAVNR